MRTPTPNRLGAATLLAALAPTLAAGQATNCQRDLATAEQRIGTVRQRERTLNASVQRGDVAGACRLLRENQADITAARDIMAQCLTGFERRENLGQLDASLADIRDVLAARCR